MSLPTQSIWEFDLGTGVRAGFTTSVGGFTHGAWGEFNLGLNVGDDPDLVLANRKLLERHMGAPVAYAAQVHGSDFAFAPVWNRALPDRGCARSSPGFADADAIIVTRETMAAAVLVADCVPVLVADAEAGVGAVIHAGRAGLLSGVVGAAVGAMIDAGARSNALRAVIGPAACGRCYEVPTAMQAEVTARIPVAASETRNHTPALDLPAGVQAELRTAGVLTIERVATCTIESAEFYSYRRAGGVAKPTGRFAGVLAFS